VELPIAYDTWFNGNAGKGSRGQRTHSAGQFGLQTLDVLHVLLDLIQDRHVRFIRAHARRNETDSDGTEDDEAGSLHGNLGSDER